MRRVVMVAAAVLLVLEGVAVAGALWVLGLAVDHQSISLGGSDPGLVSVVAWVLGVAAGLYLWTVAALLGWAAARAATPGRPGQVMAILAAVANGLIGAVALTLTGWLVFTAVMLVLAALVGSILFFDEGSRRGRPADPGPGDGAADTPPVTPTPA